MGVWGGRTGQPRGRGSRGRRGRAGRARARRASMLRGCGIIGPSGRAPRPVADTAPPGRPSGTLRVVGLLVTGLLDRSGRSPCDGTTVHSRRRRCAASATPTTPCGARPLSRRPSGPGSKPSGARSSPPSPGSTRSRPPGWSPATSGSPGAWRSTTGCGPASPAVGAVARPNRVSAGSPPCRAPRARSPAPPCATSRRASSSATRPSRSSRSTPCSTATATRSTATTR